MQIIQLYDILNSYQIFKKFKQLYGFKYFYLMLKISHSTNTLGKGMNPIILLPAMGK